MQCASMLRAEQSVNKCIPGVGQGDWCLEQTLTGSVAIVQECQVLVHPEPLWGNDARGLHQLRQHLQHVVGPVLGGQELLQLIGWQCVLYTAVQDVGRTF